MRKFYQSVAVTKSEGGYAVQLDGKPASRIAYTRNMLHDMVNYI
jgi:chaperone required for assembly of F1-ATPase